MYIYIRYMRIYIYIYRYISHIYIYIHICMSQSKPLGWWWLEDVWSVWHHIPPRMAATMALLSLPLIPAWCPNGVVEWEAMNERDMPILHLNVSHILFIWFMIAGLYPVTNENQGLNWCYNLGLTVVISILKSINQGQLVLFFWADLSIWVSPVADLNGEQ